MMKVKEPMALSVCWKNVWRFPTLEDKVRNIQVVSLWSSRRRIPRFGGSRKFLVFLLLS
jgi:hypothetical protein